MNKKKKIILKKIGSWKKKIKKVKNELLNPLISYCSHLG